MPDLVLGTKDTVVNFSSYVYVSVSQVYSLAPPHIITPQHFHIDVLTVSQTKQTQN